MPNRHKPLLAFADVADTTDGVIFKAGLQDSDTDANGIGVNGTLTDPSGYVDFSQGGLSTTVATTSVSVTITIPSAYQAGLRGQGRLQFDVKKSALAGMINQNLDLIGLFDAATSDAHGPRVIFNGSTAQYADDTTGNHANAYCNTIEYGILQLDATWAAQRYETADSQASICVINEGDEWATLTVSWTPTLVTWLQDGHTVTRSGHANPTADLTKVVISVNSTALADRLPIRNVILCDHPAPDTHEVSGYDIPRVVAMGHSFWLTGGGITHIDCNTAFDTIERCGCLHHLANQIHYQYTKGGGAMNFKNLAHDGNVRSAAATVITGHAESLTPANTTLDWDASNVIANRILRYRPHIVLLMVHGSDSVAATVDTQLQAIIDALIAADVIPIVIREQNRDAGGTDRTTIDEQVVSTVGVYTAANGDNWVGLVDMWTPTGGSTVNTDYVENSGSLIHPSLDVGPLYGAAVVAEIRRLLADPPSYSAWANR